MPLGDLLRRPILSPKPPKPRRSPFIEDDYDPLAEADRQLADYDPLAEADRQLAQWRPPPSPPPPPSPLLDQYANVTGVNKDLDALGVTPEERRLMAGGEARLRRYLGQPDTEPAPPPVPPVIASPSLPSSLSEIRGAPAVGMAWDAAKAGFGLARAGAHAATTAVGEEIVGPLPGHEQEQGPDALVFGFPVRRMTEHAKKLWASGGEDMQPSDPAVMAKSDSVWHMTPADRDLWKRRGRPDPGEWHVPTEAERIADEVARGVVNDAFTILTDPTTHAAAGISGIPTKVLGYAFATDGMKAAYDTLNDPEASRADKILSVVRGTMMAGPVVTHAVIEHGPTVARTVGPPVVEGATAAGKTAATAGAAALSPVARLMRETILAAKLGLPNITRAAPEAVGAGTRAPLTAMERVGGSELPENLPGATPRSIPTLVRDIPGMVRDLPETVRTAGNQMLDAALRRTPEAKLRNEVRAPDVTVPPEMTRGMTVETPDGQRAVVVRTGVPPGTRMPLVTVQLPDGLHEQYRPDVLTPESAEPRGILTRDTTPPEIVEPPAPELTQPELGLAAQPAPGAVLPKVHGELRADTMEKARELARERTDATGLPHAVIEAPHGFIISAERHETPSQYPPAQPDESVRDYQRRARVPFTVAQEMVDAVRAAPPAEQPAPASEEQLGLFGDEPPAPVATSARYTHKGRDFDVTFANPIDETLYHASSPKATETDKQQLAQLSETTGASGAHLQAQGVELRAAIKAQAASAEPGVTRLDVPASDFSVPYAHAVQSAGAPNARETDYRGPGGVTGTAARAVPAAARPDNAGPSAPAVAARPALTEAYVNALIAHPRFKGYRVTATPEGHIAIHPPTGLPIIGQILHPSAFPSSFDSDHGIASFLAEANASGTTHYRMGGGNRVSQHPLPTTLAAFNALPRPHQEKLRSRFVVAGRYNPDTDTLHISEDWAHDPDIWAEEHFHAGVARMTPEEKKAAKVETKAEEEAAFREGWRVPLDIYARPRGNLSSEGQPHGTQAETDAVSRATRQVRRPDGAGDENLRPRTDARGARGVQGEARRGGSTAEEVARRLADDFDRLRADVAKPDGGFTYSPHSGSPTSGYALSVTKGAERILDSPDQLTSRALTDYIIDHAEHWDNPRNYIGAWHNPKDGKIYLDVSTVVKTYEDAERLGTENQQLAYYDLKGGRSYETKYGERQNAERLQGEAMPTVVRGSPTGGAPTLAHQPEPSYAVRDNRPVEEKRAYRPVEKAASLKSVMAGAGKDSFDRRRDFKIYLQDLVRRAAADAGVNLDPATGKGKGYVIDPAARAYLVRVGLRDALYALGTNDEAVGWYDLKVSQALAVLATMHPEIVSDPHARMALSVLADKSTRTAETARFAFTFALAVTSNGIQVNKNFQLAEQAYQHFKRTGEMPTDIGEGTSATQMNNAMDAFNHYSAKWGMDDFRKFMFSQFTVGELKKLGFKITGEPVALVARGALIIGAKIGNGFFSNLNGDFDSLTMDRWLMRTWGRWTGKLFNQNAAKVEENRVRTRSAIDALLTRPEAAKAFGDLIGHDLSNVTPSTTAWSPEMNVKGDGDNSLDRVAYAIMKSSEKPANREVMNALDLPHPDGSELRRAGNIHAKNIDAQKEAPASSTERTLIRGIFRDILNGARARGKALTMADLQALVWYPEKRLYDKATSEEEVDEGYEEDEAPDYANAARDLARSSGIGDRAIQNALDRGARHRTGRAGSVQPGSSGHAASGTETFTAADRQAFLERWTPPKPSRKSKTAPADEDAAAADEDVAPSYGIRDTDAPLTLDKLQREATKGGVSLADAVAQARAEGRDINVDDYFNFKRVNLPDEELQALKDHVIDTAVATGRVPKERVTFEETLQEAKELDPSIIETQLERGLEHQRPFRAVKAAARQRVNVLNREIYEQTKALATLPSGLTADTEREIAEKRKTVQALLDLSMRAASEAGRGLAMHRMEHDSAEWDDLYWLTKAKQQMGIPPGVDLPDNVYADINDILRRGEEATAEARAAGDQGEPPVATQGEPPVEEAVPPTEPREGSMTRRPRVQGPVLPPIAPREGPMTRGEPVQGPVLPPEESRGRMTSTPPVQGPVLPPPAESRGRMTSKPPVQGPVLPPRESRGPMTRGEPRQGPVLPKAPPPFRLTPPPGDPKPSDKMHGPPLSYPPTRGQKAKRSPKEDAIQLELFKYLNHIKKTSWPEAIGLMYKAGLLTGAGTHLINAVGNLTFQGMEEVARIPAAVADMLIATRTGQRTVQGMNLMAVARAGRYAATTGLKEASATLRTGTHDPDELRKIGGTREMNTGKRILDVPTNAVFRVLAASDRIFKSYAYQRSMEAQAAVMSKNLKGTKSPEQLLERPTQAMVIRAIYDADFATFNNKNLIAGGYQMGLNAVKRQGRAGAGVGLVADVIIPFSNTPANIVERMLDYAGPLSAVKMIGATGVGAYEAMQTRRLAAAAQPQLAARAGGGAPPPQQSTAAGGAPPPGGPPFPTQPLPLTAEKGPLRVQQKTTPQSKAAAAALMRKAALSDSMQRMFAEAFGRGMEGAALLTLGGVLAAKGLLTGMADEDPGQRNVQEAAGRQPGSVLIYGHWIKISNVAPFGGLLTLGASLYERRDSYPKIGMSVLRLMKDQPMLAGISALISGIDRPQTSGERAVSQQIGAAIPTIVSDVAATFDPWRRDAKPEEFVEWVYKGVQARFPGARNQLPLRTDIFGEPIPQSRTKIINPTNPTADKSNDPVIKALLKYKLGIDVPDRVDDLETADQYRERRNRVGKAIRLALREALQSDDWADADNDEARRDVLERAILAGRNTVPRPSKPVRD